MIYLVELGGPRKFVRPSTSTSSHLPRPDGLSVMLRVASLLFFLASTIGYQLPAMAVGRRATARASAASMAMERTYIMIKPDGVQRGLVGEIIKRFEQRGYKCAHLLRA